MQAHAENALNPELEFASLISQIHTHTHKLSRISPIHTHLKLPNLRVCVCVSPPSWVWAKFLSKINI